MDSRNNKDPIERLFQQKAEEYDISYQEKDWLKLEKQLDEHDQIIASRRMRWFVAAAVILIFSLLGYAIYQNSQEIERLHQQLQEQELAKNSGNNQPNTPDTVNKETKTDPDDNQTAPQPPGSRALEPGSDIASSNSERSNNQTNYPQATDQTDFIVAAGDVHETTGELPCGDCQLGDLVERGVSTFGAVAGEDIPPTSYLATTEEQYQSPSPYQVASRRQAQGLHSRVSVGVLAGPDLSTAGSLSDFHSPGYSLGFSIAYRIHSDISIQAGFIRSVSRTGFEYRRIAVGFSFTRV